MASLVEQTRQLEERQATVDRQTDELATSLNQAAVDRDRLYADRLAFNTERQAFAEELVRMNTVNKMNDRYLYLSNYNRSPAA